MPHSNYYKPDTFLSAKRAEFFEWYNEQVRHKTIFDFHEEMNMYCHSDVNLLRKGMEKLREQFLMLTKADGTPILVDPFNYMTIAGVVFAGIFVHTFYPKTPLSLFHIHQMRIIHSNRSCGMSTWLTQTPDCSFSTSVRKQFMYQVENVESGWFCEATNTVYQFDGCSYHRCPFCYKAVAPPPHRVKMRKGKIRKRYNYPSSYVKCM